MCYDVASYDTVICEIRNNVEVRADRSVFKYTPEDTMKLLPMNDCHKKAAAATVRADCHK